MPGWRVRADRLLAPSLVAKRLGGQETDLASKSCQPHSSDQVALQAPFATPRSRSEFPIIVRYVPAVLEFLQGAFCSSRSPAALFAAPQCRATSATERDV